MRFEGLLARHERGEPNQEEAAEMLGISERTFRRWRDRLRDEGPVGLRDRRIGKPSSRRAATEEILRMLGLYQERYSGFTVKHFHEPMTKRHDYKLGYTVNGGEPCHRPLTPSQPRMRNGSHGVSNRACRGNGKPVLRSRRLHAGRRLGRQQVSPNPCSRDRSPGPGFDVG
jgi:hypothetical protein